MGLFRFVYRAARYAFSGGPVYLTWLGFLAILAVWGLTGYVYQLHHGLIATHMRDQVSWGFYIGNFTFLVGVAAAAVILVIPAYVYDWKPIKEVAILGEILAISALIMCMLFVCCDIGRPDRIWHLIPYIGRLHWPSSMLSWDVLWLNSYFFLNVFIVSYMLYCSYHKVHYNKKLIYPLVILSIPAAIGIHTVTAFIYMGMCSRPFWTDSILAPRFIASALCSGPAILLVLFQLLKRTTSFDIKDEALWKIAEIMAYAMGINLLLSGAEIFKEMYDHTQNEMFFNYLYVGIRNHHALVPFGWASLICSVAAFILFIIPATRRNPITLNLGCLLIYSGVYIEKGMGLVIPGMTPDTLGEIYEYTPTITELKIGVAIMAIGFIVYSLLTRVAVGILLGDLTVDGETADGTSKVSVPAH